ncbi:MAG: hypothetical protein FGM57_00805 [Candidatus Taylorbacteria bacterium]|nr:hypothetical protein [Candidatus Taylorbacteria bacterium]
MKKNIHQAILSTFIICAVAIMSQSIASKIVEAVSVTYPTDMELDSILKESPNFKAYEEVLKSSDTDKAYGKYSASYLGNNPSITSEVKAPIEGKMYCGDTTIYTISGESPSQYKGSLKNASYNTFWSGDWFHSFVHDLKMYSNSKDSEKMLFPSVPGWRLDGVWDSKGITYDNKIQHTQNAFQITRVENGQFLATPYESDGEPVGVAAALAKRLRIDFTWYNNMPHFPFKRRVLIVGNGLGADAAYQLSKTFNGPGIDYIYVDPYKLSKEDAKDIVRWGKPSVDFASFRLNNNLFSGKITSSTKARNQAYELYQEIKKVVDKNRADRDSRCDNYESLGVCSVPWVFIQRALDRKEPYVTNPLAECGNEAYPVPFRFLKPYDPEIKESQTRFTSTGNANPVSKEVVYQNSDSNTVSEYLDDLFKYGTKSGGRTTDGTLHFTSYGSANDKTPDSNTKQQRGNNNNLLTLGSVALSPDLIRKYRPAHGAEIIVNGVHIGYYDDSSASTYKGISIVNTIDLYDPNNKYDDALFRIIPAGKWKLTLGPVRPQIPNIPNSKKSVAKNKNEKPKTVETKGADQKTAEQPKPNTVSYTNPLLPPPPAETKREIAENSSLQNNKTEQSKLVQRFIGSHDNNSATTTLNNARPVSTPENTGILSKLLAPFVSFFSLFVSE